MKMAAVFPESVPTLTLIQNNIKKIYDIMRRKKRMHQS